MNLILRRNALAGPSTGGIAATQGTVDFCARNKTVSRQRVIANSWTRHGA